MTLNLKTTYKSEFWADNNPMRPHTPPTLRNANSSRSTLQPQSDQISKHFTCMHGPHSLLQLNMTRDEIAQAYYTYTKAYTVGS